MVIYVLRKSLTLRKNKPLQGHVGRTASEEKKRSMASSLPGYKGKIRRTTGVLLATISQLPSSVLNLMAKPRGSLAVSAEPASPPTVEKRKVVRALFPTLEKMCAEVKSEMSWVTSKTPCAADPFASEKRGIMC